MYNIYIINLLTDSRGFGITLILHKDVVPHSLTFCKHQLYLRDGPAKLVLVVYVHKSVNIHKVVKHVPMLFIERSFIQEAIAS